MQPSNKDQLYLAHTFIVLSVMYVLCFDITYMWVYNISITQLNYIDLFYINYPILAMVGFSVIMYAKLYINKVKEGSVDSVYTHTKLSSSSKFPWL